MISHCSSNFHFSNNEWCWACCHVPLAICMFSWEKGMFRFLDYFEWWYWHPLGIPDLKPIAGLRFANIFCQSVCCPSTAVSFHAQVLKFDVSPICLVSLLWLSCSLYFLSISLMCSRLLSSPATGLVYITTSQQNAAMTLPPLLLDFIPHTFPPPWVNNMTL